MEDVRREPAKTPPARLTSIDALRGFDMFWIMGGDAAAHAWVKWAGWPSPEVVNTQLEHAAWEGFRFYDLIFPLFLFLVGVVIPFSSARQREVGASPAQMHGRIVRRTLLLFALGLLCNNILQFNWDNLRVAGVLQRIAICYGCAALIVMHTGWRGQALISALILLGYWGIMTLIPVPGFAAGDLTREGNLSGYIDRHFLPGKIFEAYYGFGDNEGMLSTLPAIATALLGALAGQWLRFEPSSFRRVLGLILAGIAFVLLGNAWGATFPIIKNIWTSSFVLVAAGWSLLLLALFHWVIDVLGFRWWAFFFVVIGANAITIFVVPRFVDFSKMTAFFLGGAAKMSGEFRPVLLALGVIAFKWLFLFYLYRRRLFLRV